MKKNSKRNVALKASAVVAAALTSMSTNAANVDQVNVETDSNDNVIQATPIKKPMPILKINMNDVNASKFVANHTSHRSHSSHRSHYSHRSGALFS